MSCPEVIDLLTSDESDAECPIRNKPKDQESKRSRNPGRRAKDLANTLLKRGRDDYNVIQRQDYQDTIVLSTSQESEDDFLPRTKRTKRKSSNKYSEKPLKFIPVDLSTSLETIDSEEFQESCNKKDQHENENKYRIEKDEKDSKMYMIKNKSLNIDLNSLCLACEGVQDISKEHPMFEGGLCEGCSDGWREAAFALGQDGDNVFCIVCLGSGTLIQCSDSQCLMGFCTGCIRDLISVERVNAIQNQDDWFCFLCSPYSKKTHGLLKPRENWRNTIKTIFQPDGLRVPIVKQDEGKKAIRVLSLFDGLSTGLLILQELGIEVEVYYACEIDPDALAVSQYHHSSIVHLGDVSRITHEKLQEIGPIDLLLGGSPCQDFALVNAYRKGFGGDQGSLFFEYHRIWELLPQLFKDRHMFWLFENVTMMEHEVRDKISRYFRCKPAKWNSLSFTAMKRDRCFWGNLPTIYCPVSYSEQSIKRIELKDVLMGHNRKPNLRFISTVTSSSTTFQQESAPVLYGNQYDRLWIPEIEKLFGFPQHYTDVNDLTTARRQKLLGNSWSIPVVKHLLSPLRLFFKASRKARVEAPMPIVL